MAYIEKDDKGYRVRFRDQYGKRKNIRLSKFDKRGAETAKTHIEAILAAQLGNYAINKQTADWIANIGDDIRDRLAKLGLVEVQQRTTLGQHIERYLEKSKAKESTRKSWRTTFKALLSDFGPNCDLREITPANAEDWLNSLPVKENTQRKYCKEAKTLFAYAVKARIIDENPFAGLASTTVANEERMRFISVADSEAVLEACPDARWRSIFALARWGGLRCPSEVLAVKWEHVDWDATKGRLIVPTGKTKQRVVPLFPELRAVLEESYEAARVGEVYIVPHDGDRQTGNLGTTMQKIVRRAGIQPWPKAFQNLRSTRQTELMDSYPIHCVVKWIGKLTHGCTQALPANDGVAP